ncbi:hypothetical protein JTB14_000394 [Gonioctena quinquepunctata]|nr:hypothetical protein JTB14_000394 [Gonioctena quinquepunctata]
MLAVTLRYLASGCTFTELHYTYRIGISTAKLLNLTGRHLPLEMRDTLDWIRLLLGRALRFRVHRDQRPTSLPYDNSLRGGYCIWQTKTVLGNFSRGFVCGDMDLRIADTFVRPSLTLKRGVHSCNPSATPLVDQLSGILILQNGTFGT